MAMPLNFDDEARAMVRCYLVFGKPFQWRTTYDWRERAAMARAATGLTPDQLTSFSLTKEICWHRRSRMDGASRICWNRSHVNCEHN